MKEISLFRSRPTKRCRLKDGHGMGFLPSYRAMGCGQIVDCGWQRNASRRASHVDDTIVICWTSRRKQVVAIQCNGLVIPPVNICIGHVHASIGAGSSILWLRQRFRICRPPTPVMRTH